MRDRASPPILIRRAPGVAGEMGGPDLPPGLRAALGRLADWTALVDLFAEAAGAGGPAAAAAFQRLLDACAEAGWLEEGLGDAAAPAMTCRNVPGSGLGPAPVAVAVAAADDGPLVFAAHCTIWPGADGWRIGSPLATGEATVRDPKLFAALGRAAQGWTPEGALERAAARLLCRAGLLRPNAAPPAATPLATEELWLHAMSRRGSAAGPVGATGRADAGRAAPARRPGPMATPVALPAPIRGAGPRFADVLGARRSWRATPPGACLPADEIGALLWQAARDLAPPRRDAEGFERLSRPVPSAGGAHAADLFLALNPAPAGLPVFARYDAARHALLPIAADPARLLREAAASMGQTGGPAGLVILSARFARLTWKYGDASYALILKDAGVLLQTLHLAATALGRGSCILGGGNSRVFADLTGLDPLVDGPVGEIALTGRLPAVAAEGELVHGG
jgi:SagB-type dehydrogenase family enzyme